MRFDLGVAVPGLVLVGLGLGSPPFHVVARSDARTA